MFYDWEELIFLLVSEKYMDASPDDAYDERSRFWYQYSLIG